jgi:hypothetical protein
VERWATTERAEVEKVIEAAGKKPTRNLVLFDDKDITILKRNEKTFNQRVQSARKPK